LDIALKLAALKLQNVGRLPDNINILSKLYKILCKNNKNISNGVMLNASDSIGEKFSDTIDMLKMTEFKVFFFVIRFAHFFNSDLDRGFPLLIMI
jgi:hypothetical protein